MFHRKLLPRRAGDVIPQVLGLADDTRGVSRGQTAEVFEFPTTCPACGTKVVREQVGEKYGHSYLGRLRAIAKWWLGRASEECAADGHPILSACTFA